MFDFGIVTKWIDDLLNGFLPGWLSTTIECALVGVALLLMYSIIAIIYIFYERKLCAWIQCRLGPMRVGPWCDTGVCRCHQDFDQGDCYLVGHRPIPL